MDNIYNLLILAIPLAFILIGFLRSQIDGNTPDGIISEKEIANKWLSENNWSARFSILFLPLVFLYNLIVWIVFGIISLFEFISFVFKKLWWLLVFVWNEVLHPTIFWLAKLVWHYPIGYSWRFFEFSFKHISPSLKQNSIVYSVKQLLKLGTSGAILMIIYLIYPNLISLIIGIVLFVLYFQLVVFQSISNFRPEFSEQKNKPSLKMVATWLGFAVLTAGILAGITLLDIYSLSALGLTLSQILIPILFLASIAFVSATTCLAPYFQNVDKINTLDFLKAILYRLPKLVFAQPFQLIGLSIVGIIPFLIVFALNYGSSIVTGNDYVQWTDEVISIKEHLPAYKEARESIQSNKNTVEDLSIEKDSVVENYNLILADFEDKRTKAEALKNQIQNNKIHTFKGDAYVGERQFFSIPAISNCAEYKWIVEKDGNKIYEKSLYSGTDEMSSVFYYTWSTPGQHTILLTPTNRCGNAEPIQAFVNVLELPVKAKILRPIGKTQVCENEELTYKTERGYDIYEWKHPFGETSTTSEELSLTWGNVSGTIQVRGVNNDGSKTLWGGVEVFVTSLPFSKNTNNKLLKDETQNEFKISRDFAFKTIEEAQDSITRIVSLIETLSQEKEDFAFQQDSKIKALNDENQILRKRIWQNAHHLLGKILAAFGLVLAISLLLSTVFTYLLLFHFDLFNFRQEGKHYWQETLSEIRLKNPQQPLMGIFILIVVISLISLFV